MSKIISVTWVKDFVKNVSDGALHLSQVESLANAVYGALFSNRLSITAIGRSLAKRTGRCPKHAIKQVDRLVGNKGIASQEMFRGMCHTAVGPRRKIQVSLDWTEYDDSDQSRITINLITKHGRATPLVWLTAVKSRLKNHRTEYEKKALRLLSDSLPEGIEVIVVADRGFGSIGLFSYIKKKLGWNYIIRIKGIIEFYDEQHPLGRKTEELRLVRGGPPRVLRNVLLTHKRHRLEALVAVWDREMKEPWYLATSLSVAQELVVKYYSRRFTCEEHYRDEKDDRFGAGSKETRVGTIERRDMLTIIHAIATMILTIVGAAGERIGYDRRLRANTEKRRTHSLYRQGKEYVDGVEIRFLAAFREAIEIIRAEHAQLTELYGVI
jgi:hypothetical protein